eukprot:15456226-Alexandrium_andersonii.AAC.1
MSPRIRIESAACGRGPPSNWPWGVALPVKIDKYPFVAIVLAAPSRALEPVCAIVLVARARP